MQCAFYAVIVMFYACNDSVLVVEHLHIEIRQADGRNDFIERDFRRQSEDGNVIRKAAMNVIRVYGY